MIGRGDTLVACGAFAARQDRRGRQECRPSLVNPVIDIYSTEDTVTSFAGAKGGRHGYFIFDLENYRRVMSGIAAFLEKHRFIE